MHALACEVLLLLIEAHTFHVLRALVLINHPQEGVITNTYNTLPFYSASAHYVFCPQLSGLYTTTMYVLWHNHIACILLAHGVQQKKAI